MKNKTGFGIFITVIVICIIAPLAVYIASNIFFPGSGEHEIPTVEDINNNDELCDYFAIDGDGEAVQEYGYSCTSYIDCDGADSIDVVMMDSESASGYGLSFYDSNKNYVSSLSSDSEEVTTVNIMVPTEAKYFRTTYYDYATRKDYEDFSYTINYADNRDVNQYRPYQEGLIFYSAEINQSLDSSDTSNYKVTTGVLALPESYSETGEPTPLIMYFHGYSHYVYYGTWGSTDTFLTQKQNFLDKGYAVMDCNGARDNYMQNHFTSAGSSQYVDGYRKCYEWVVEHYNIDTEIYVVGGSAGGPAAINYCYTYNNVKALMLLSAWTDLYKCSWGQNVRDTFVEYLGFENTTTYEAEKTIGYDPALHIKTDESGTEYIDDLTIPVQAYIGSLESSHIIYSTLYRFMNALMVTNSNADIYEWEGKTHTQIVSGGLTEIDYAITDYFDTFKAKE